MFPAWSAKIVATCKIKEGTGIKYGKHSNRTENNLLHYLKITFLFNYVLREAHL